MSEEPNGTIAPTPVARVSLFGRRPRAEAPLAQTTPAPPTPPRKPRRAGLSGLSGFLSFLVLGALVGVGAIAWMLTDARKAGPLAADKIVIITREDDGGPIADQLERNGIIDSATWFTVVTLFDGNRGALKRGEYAFKASASMRDVETQLLSGRVVLHSLTIPEGLTSDQVVERVRDNDILVGEVKEPPREGAILPETYKFARGETKQAILAVMAKAQTKAVDDIWKRRASDLPIKSPGELVTLASIVEKETGKADERARVAAVFVNRLKAHMKLQSDPTIVYGLVYGKGTLGHSITKAELDQPTPYNTYIIDGLPPSPITNPGKAAMEAVANPAHTKELYFVADGTGGHVFSETLDQHLKNVARWRQIEKDAKDRLAPDIPAPSAAPIHGEIEAPDPTSFGALAVPLPLPVDPGLARLAEIIENGPAGGTIAGAGAPNHPRGADPYGALAAPTASVGPTRSLTRLSKIGAARLAREALLSANGALTAKSISGKSLEDLGAVVIGVNDQPAEGLAFADDDSGPTTRGPPASVPLSPAMLADQRAREAKYGLGSSAERMVVSLNDTPATQPAAASSRLHGFDASEGTALDPLLNKTFDLSYAKTVPTSIR